MILTFEPFLVSYDGRPRLQLGVQFRCPCCREDFTYREPVYYSMEIYRTQNHDYKRFEWAVQSVCKPKGWISCLLCGVHFNATSLEYDLLLDAAEAVISMGLLRSLQEAGVVPDTGTGTMPSPDDRSYTYPAWSGMQPGAEVSFGTHRLMPPTSEGDAVDLLGKMAEEL